MFPIHKTLALFCLIAILSSDPALWAQEAPAFRVVGTRVLGILKLKELPEELGTIDLAKNRGVVVNIRMRSDKKGFLEVRTSDFAVSFRAGGKEDRASCVGFRFGEEMWAMKKGEEASMHVNFDIPAAVDGLFFVPRGVRQVTLLQKQPDGKSAVVQRGLVVVEKLLPGSAR